MKRILSLALLFAISVPIVARAEPQRSVLDVQKAAQARSFYNGPLDGRIDVDVVVAASKLCEAEADFCSAADRISFSYFADQANAIRVASITNKEFLQRINPLLEKNMPISGDIKAVGAIFSMMMRGSVFTNVIPNKNNYLLVFDNPVIGLITVFYMYQGLPSKIIFYPSDGIGGVRNTSDFPNWLSSESGKLSQISEDARRVQSYIEENKAGFQSKIFDGDELAKVQNIVRFRLIHTFESAHGGNAPCVVSLDQGAKKEGFLYGQYKKLRGGEDEKTTGPISRFLPSNGFDVGNDTYLRAYSSIENPEENVVVSVDKGSCEIKGIAYPLAGP